MRKGSDFLLLTPIPRRGSSVSIMERLVFLCLNRDTKPDKCDINHFGKPQNMGKKMINFELILQLL